MNNYECHLGIITFSIATPFHLFFSLLFHQHIHITHINYVDLLNNTNIKWHLDVDIIKDSINNWINDIYQFIIVLISRIANAFTSNYGYLL